MTFKKVKENQFAFYYDDDFIGTIYRNLREHQWTVVGASRHKMYPLKGIYSRKAAADLLLRTEGVVR